MSNSNCSGVKAFEGVAGAAGIGAILVTIVFVLLIIAGGLFTVQISANACACAQND
ncbi:hypothetical protein LC087_11210 [Bacillus carboniphilus]|uniref:Uncharacterized protein n=1 Tax=Bacillus carboniphilus TaxID=86663 RepID=A0ABY9JPY9_9BACI|nr:hypothetical protein [Bacillus carboniphilus]WLR41466.1 hypothetical protein LC087_11210 [Bacillus carboniphilus]